RRIGDDRERRRLKSIVRELKPKGFGFIVRTVCQGKRKEDIQADMDYLVKIWSSIREKMESSQSPAILYEEPDLTLRTIRDSFSRDIEKLTIEPKEEYDRAMEFVYEFLPDLRESVAAYEGEQPMFDTTGIDVELNEALESKVWLPSGGFLVMDQMEALTAIDVNTGKYVGKKNSEQTILRTNLESVAAIVHQLRLRNIGGIIVIDFIDMLRLDNREKVYRTLKEALKVDKARTNILKVSELGIIEMTRKRIRESIGQSLLESCSYCDGDGRVKSKETVALEIYRALYAELKHKRRKLVVYANPDVAEHLESSGIVREIKERFSKKIIPRAVDVFHQEEFEII
ncbi:MAG: Rne/Rng family ribonuclease, partial [Deltaproteobacteria bacterium]|nr:Rne/Rng family ribonuclease [Deltaproteobacteria bacterium]